MKQKIYYVLAGETLFGFSLIEIFDETEWSDDPELQTFLERVKVFQYRFEVKGEHRISSHVEQNQYLSEAVEAAVSGDEPDEVLKCSQQTRAAVTLNVTECRDTFFETVAFELSKTIARIHGGLVRTPEGVWYRPDGSEVG